MMRTGKIARLPRELRDELNRRMAANESGGALVRWLNGLPEMQRILADEFEGKRLTKQNLCEWRAGGFAEWKARQELVDEAREFAADAAEFSRATGGKLAGHLSTMLAARYAKALAGWNGVADEAFMQQLRVLRVLCRDVAELRWGEDKEARLLVVEQRLEWERERTEEEVFEQFNQWLRNPAVHEMAVSTHVSEEEKERRLRVILGLDLAPEMSEEEASLEQMNKYRKVFGMEPKTLEDDEDKDDKGPE